ncbi:MAG: hypothetical protein JO352_16205 [Chloroflexi bacterium]|nr:hypothetical protein [Chloroflexota bacterium]MBV9600983.1 hypothetical protein [Chloroflexota bacterium]
MVVAAALITARLGAGPVAGRISRISEGWKDILLRLGELGFRGAAFNQPAIDNVTWLFARFVEVTTRHSG